MITDHDMTGRLSKNLNWLSRGGEMADIIRSTDWAKHL